MLSRRGFLCVLTLCGLLFFTNLAFAAASPAKEEMDGPAAAQPTANLATAAKAVMNPAGTVEAFNQSMRESEKQNQAATEAMKQAESKSAPSASAPRPGGGKVIYGDIILHK